MTSNEDLMLALGRVEGKLTGIEDKVALIREDVSEEKDNAHESRAVIHRRLDEQMKQIYLLDKVVEINAGVDAQVREELKVIKETVQKNHDAVQPTLEDWKRLKTLGYGISGLIAFAGLTIGGMVAYASDGAVAWLRHWLKIS